jgi:muramoyltetrapeptide carboxypeptidase
MVNPPFLKRGDKIGIVAPGRKINTPDVEAACSIIKSWGIDVIVPTYLNSNAHPYLAGSDAERIHDLQQLLDDPEVKAIICARGGYGTTRILDNVDFSSLFDNPKWIAGFSDITALHLRLEKLGMHSIHSTMPVLFSRPESSASVDSLRTLLFGQKTDISAPLNDKNRYGHAKGRVIGGNLSLIADSIGTSNDPDTKGKILVLEEIDEYSYRIDRMIVHLKRSGKLDDLAGLIIGHMTDIREPDLPFGEIIEDLVLSKTLDRTYPVAFNFPIGHENPNLAWVHGSLMTLNVDPTGSKLFASD